MHLSPLFIMIVIMNLGAATENPWLSLPWEEKQEAGLWMASITTRKFGKDYKAFRDSRDVFAAPPS